MTGSRGAGAALVAVSNSTSTGVSGASAAISRICSVIFIEQNFGPHMLQKCAALERVLRQRFVVHPPGGFRVERQPELLVPVEREPGPR